MEVYREATKISDILGANLVPLPTRTVLLAGGRNYPLGALMVAAAGSNVFSMMNTANRNFEQCGVLGQHTVRPEGVGPLEDYTGTLYFGGSFQEKMLLVVDEFPAASVDVRERREYLLARNIYLEG
jgi:hypothetical protein